MTRHQRYNQSEKGLARKRRYQRSPRYTATRAAYKLQQLGAK